MLPYLQLHDLCFPCQVCKDHDWEAQIMELKDQAIQILKDAEEETAAGIVDLDEQDDFSWQAAEEMW